MQLTDQIGLTLKLNKPVKSIVSLVPSLSETIADLGFEDRLSAVTRFCDHPIGLKAKKIVIGGTKNPKLSKIIALEPDLILANKEENKLEDVLRLQKCFPVYVSDVKSLEDTYRLLSDLGLLLNCEATSLQLIKKIKQKHQELKMISDSGSKKVVYLIWKEPLMTIGGDTYIHHLLEQCGLQNIFWNHKRYPIITKDSIQALDPDYIFLSSEPYPFSRKEENEFRSVYPGLQIKLVDGRMFSWYGSTTLRAMNYLMDLRKQMR